MTSFYKVLAYLSALPFLCAAAGLFLFNETLGQMLLAFLILYAGFLACFQSGLHWAHGFTQSREGQLWLSYVPVILSLVLTSWGLVLIATQMLSLTFGHILLSIALGGYILLYLAIWVMDAQWLDKTRLPDGYIALRAGVTLMISLSLIASIVFLWV